MAAGQRDLARLVEGEQAGAQPVVDVMGVVGDVVGDRGGLRLRRRRSSKPQVVRGGIVDDRRGQPVRR